MSMSFARNRIRPAAAAALMASAVIVGPVGGAWAHVRVTPDSTTAGGYSQLTFRVPTESDAASTTKLVVTLPQDRPFLSVRTKPMPGWSATVTEAKLPKPVVVDGTTITTAARTVTWTVSTPAAGIKPGEYQEFSISVGPLPAGGDVLLPAAQTYSDGKVVNWSEPTPANGVEPDRPAPAFTVTPAPAPAPEKVADASATAAGPAGEPSERDGLSIAALAVGALGVILGALALVMARARRTVA